LYCVPLVLVVLLLAAASCGAAVPAAQAGETPAPQVAQAGEMPAPQDEGPWFRRCLVGMEIGPSYVPFERGDPDDPRYCAKFDGREIVRHLVAAHGQYLVVWARDGDYAYYNSKLLPKPPGLGNRDPLREAADEAKRHGLPLITYSVIQQGGHFFDAHPELHARDAHGAPIGRFCFNSGYLEVMEKIASEQLAYGVTGCYFDMPNAEFGPPYGCWCDACRRQFEAQYGRPMPKGVTWDEDWQRMLEFRYHSSARFERALRDHVKCVNPRATVYFNYFGHPPNSWEMGQRPVEHAGNGDFVTGEAGNWGFGPLAGGLHAELYRAATPGVPYQLAMQRSLRIYADQTTRPLADIRWELFTLLSHGAMVTMVDKTGCDGSLDPVVYQRTGAAFAEALQERDDFGHAPVYDVGLYYSSRSRDWIGREKPETWFRSFLGAHKACVYEHLMAGVLLDENVTLDALRQFPVVCLPNVGILSADEVSLLRRYVEQGGNLIVTGQSGRFDRWGKPLVGGKGDRSNLPERPEGCCAQIGPVPFSALGELIGAEAVASVQAPDNWVRFSTTDGDGLLRDLRPDWPLLVHGPATVYRPTTATAFGQLLKPYRMVKHESIWPMTADAPIGPAVLINRVGKGTVLTFACSPDAATAGVFGMSEVRKLFRNAVRLLCPRPRVRIEAPANVEAVVTDEPPQRTLRIHLIGYNAPAQVPRATDYPNVYPAPIEDPPMYRVAVELAGPLKEAAAGSAATVLSARGNRVEATVHDVHEVLRIKY
jgi:hypothetical protein